MEEARRIRHQLKIGYSGKAWHGPSLKENLEGITAEMAARHPIPGSHSIWELLLHITAWERETAAVLTGKDYVTLAGAEDWPPVTDSSEEAWKAALASLETTHQTLVDEVRKLSDESLETQVPGREFTFYVLLHGVIQHNLYHGGQIALLKKAV
jgi:uncharacterized damage-inducible protein DinB